MERRRKFVWVSTFLHGWYDTNFKTYELLISIDLSWSSQISWTKILQVFKMLIVFSGYMIRMELRRLIRQINYQILLNQIKSKFDYWRELKYKFILWRDFKKNLHLNLRRQTTIFITKYWMRNKTKWVYICSCSW